MLRPYQSRAGHFEDVQHPGLPRRSGHLGNPPACQRIQETGLTDVGSTDQGDFGKGGTEWGVGRGDWNGRTKRRNSSKTTTRNPASSLKKKKNNKKIKKI